MLDFPIDLEDGVVVSIALIVDDGASYGGFEIGVAVSPFFPPPCVGRGIFYRMMKISPLKKELMLSPLLRWID